MDLSSTAVQQYISTLSNTPDRRAAADSLVTMLSGCGRDLQLFTIPRHAGGESARVADSAHSERRQLDAAVIGPGVVVVTVDEGALVISFPWLK